MGTIVREGKRFVKTFHFPTNPIMIFGMGNHIYPLSKCSMGSYLVTLLSKRLGVSMHYDPSLAASIGHYPEKNLVLAQPHTYYHTQNGKAINKIVQKYPQIKIPYTLWLYHDDHVPFGRVAVGAKGRLHTEDLRRLSEMIDTDHFLRVGLGVDHMTPNTRFRGAPGVHNTLSRAEPDASYVLNKLTYEEIKVVHETIPKVFYQIDEALNYMRSEYPLIQEPPKPHPRYESYHPNENPRDVTPFYDPTFNIDDVSGISDEAGYYSDIMLSSHPDAYDNVRSRPPEPPKKEYNVRKGHFENFPHYKRPIQSFQSNQTDYTPPSVGVANHLVGTPLTVLEERELNKTNDEIFLSQVMPQDETDDQIIRAELNEDFKQEIREGQIFFKTLESEGVDTKKVAEAFEKSPDEAIEELDKQLEALGGPDSEFNSEFDSEFEDSDSETK